jgi:hypothetical protein
MKRHFIEVPDAAHYWLLGARVPLTCLEGWQAPTAEACLDSTVRVDLEVRNGRIAAIDPASRVAHRDGTRIVDLRGSMVFPTFVDLHTHIGAPSQGCLGSHGSVTGATAGRARAAEPAAGLAASQEVLRRACSYGAGYTRARPAQTRAIPASAAATPLAASAARTAAPRATRRSGTGTTCSGAGRPAAGTRVQPAACSRQVNPAQAGAAALLPVPPAAVLSRRTPSSHASRDRPPGGAAADRRRSQSRPPAPRAGGWTLA